VRREAEQALAQAIRGGGNRVCGGALGERR